MRFIKGVDLSTLLEVENAVPVFLTAEKKKTFWIF